MWPLLVHARLFGGDTHSGPRPSRRATSGLNRPLRTIEGGQTRRLDRRRTLPATIEALGPTSRSVTVTGGSPATLGCNHRRGRDPGAVGDEGRCRGSVSGQEAQGRRSGRSRLDNVDVEAATQAGVMVVNAPTSNIVSAAELAVALLLASARHISPGP